MTLASDFLADYPRKAYLADCRANAAYEKWAAQFRQANGWTVIPVDAKPKGIAARVDNALRSRIERFELFTNPPEKFTAYIGDSAPNGCGIDKEYGRTYPLTVWTGDKLGYCTIYKIRRMNSAYGSWQYQVNAWITGADGIERQYIGRSFGVGMMVKLRQSAESKRKLAA